MIKLKNILSEDFPKPIIDIIVKWKKSLKKGQLIVKEMGRVAWYDELYQYLGDTKRTDDYSNKGNANIAAKVSKIGIILYDHQFGLTIDLFSEHPNLNSITVKLDANWRFLSPDETEVLKKSLKIHPQKNVDMGSEVGEYHERTYRDMIEDHNRCKIII